MVGLFSRMRSNNALLQSIEQENFREDGIACPPELTIEKLARPTCQPCQFDSNVPDPDSFLSSPFSPKQQERAVYDISSSPFVETSTAHLTTPDKHDAIPMKIRTNSKALATPSVLITDDDIVTSPSQPPQSRQTDRNYDFGFPIPSQEPTTSKTPPRRQNSGTYQPGENLFESDEELSPLKGFLNLKEIKNNSAYTQSVYGYLQQFHIAPEGSRSPQPVSKETPKRGRGRNRSWRKKSFRKK
jgi:hypothetical protein